VSLKQEFTVEPAEDGLRLDKFLVARLPGQSRSQLQKLVTSGLVRVNGKQPTKHHFLSPGDRVVIDQAAALPAAKKGQQLAVDVRVLVEDDDLVVIEKPVGVLVHPVEGHMEWTLVDWLVARAPAAAMVGESRERAGVVHRLDRDVSGVMVLCKSPVAYAAMKQQFQARTVQKEYRAIVHGVPAAASGVIKFRIGRSKTSGGKMAARPEHEAGREAWTEYEVLRAWHGRYAELAVHIKTGRTHQIRVHLAAIDHPVVGDNLYSSKHYRSQKQYPRLFLHSHRLAFAHPKTGEFMEFVSPEPAQFAEFLAA
jgi:23S rRNA pseudouridine1911/1915/1917 synthase